MKTEELTLYVQNMDCEHDAATLERGMGPVPGVVGLKIYPKSARVTVTYDEQTVTPAVVERQLEALGFPPRAGREAPEPPQLWRNPQVLASAASGLLLAVGWLLAQAGVSETISLGFYVTAMLVGGYYFGREAIEELIFERQIGIELLMSVAAVAATLLGAAEEGAMLVFLYSISEALEGYTEDKTRSAVRALMDLTPKLALVRRDGQETEIPVEDLEVGDLFIVKPGQSVPTDGVVLTGRSNVNQAPVTGESVPVEKQPDQPVFAGTINGEGALEVRVTKAFADNTIARIIHMVEEAQEKKGQNQRFIERFGARYSPLVLLAGVLVAILPPLLFGGAWETWLTRAVVFIVAAAPCALVISVPITLVAALGTGARQGVLIKGGLYVEALADIQVVALDKTGTLTRGEPEVTDVLPLNSRVPGAKTERETVAVAAGIERRSQHPLALAITRYADAQGVEAAATEEFQSLTGAGATARYDGTAVYVGSPDSFAQRMNRPFEEDSQTVISRLQDEGKTVVIMGDDHSPWALFAIRDNVRANARRAIDGLRAQGVERVVMLTGDNERTARAIAREVGLDEFYADLKPEDKVARVRELEARYGRVAMVGDGVNDAPALATASVGIAMGAAGTDVALETADVALMADDLERLVYALKLARRNRSVVRQNLVLSVAVIAVLVVGALSGLFTLPIAVLAHEISEFVVVGSGLRMLRA